MKKKKQLKDNRGCLQKYLNGQSGQFTVRAKGKQNLKALKKFHKNLSNHICHLHRSIPFTENWLQQPETSVKGELREIEL